jgi:hypothetical protein
MTVIIDQGMSSSAIIQPRPAARRSSTSAMHGPDDQLDDHGDHRVVDGEASASRHREECISRL